MPPFLWGGPHIQITAAGKCFGKRKKEWAGTEGVFKDVMGWGCVWLAAV